VFVTVDLDGSHKDPVVSFFGVKEEAAPAVVGFDMKSNKKYKFPDPKITEKGVKAFAQSLVDGKLVPEYKSAPIPDEPLDGGVAVRGGARGPLLWVAASVRPLLLWVGRRSARGPEGRQQTHSISACRNRGALR